MRNGAPTMAPTVCRGFSDAVRVLEDHLHVAAERAQSALLQVRDVVALEGDLPAGRLDQPGDQAAGGGLAAARLAHQAQRLALAHVEADAVDGLDRADLRS